MSAADRETANISLPYEDRNSPVGLTGPSSRSGQENRGDDEDGEMVPKVESSPLKHILLWPIQLLRVIYVTLGIFFFGKPNFVRWHDNEGDLDYVELPPPWKLVSAPLVIWCQIMGFTMDAANAIIHFIGKKVFGRRPRPKKD